MSLTILLQVTFSVYAWMNQKPNAAKVIKHTSTPCIYSSFIAERQTCILKAQKKKIKAEYQYRKEKETERGRKEKGSMGILVGG